MHASYLLTLGAAALASAAPASSAKKQNHFDVTNFVFGCTAGCYYNFNVTVPDSAQNHPAILTPVHCSGSLDDDKDYVTCGHISQTQSIAAYIVKDTNELKLRYNVENPTEGSYYSYFGEKRVYAATSADAAKQKSSFEVKESRATGVA